MSVWRKRIARVVLALTIVAGGSAIAAPADAVGFEVYRTDRFGNKTSRVTGFGSVGPACCCVWHGEGAVGLGVRVCYLPIP